MKDPHNQTSWAPPIPTPDGSQRPNPGAYQSTQRAIDRSDFKNAPPIVRSARLLTVLGTAVAILTIMFGFVIAADRNSAQTAPAIIAVASLVLGVNVWLNIALTKGKRAAWTGQTVVSILTILISYRAVLLLLAHAYLLSQWFKPEVKEWFDVA